jgi:hypothetical protein
VQLSQRLINHHDGCRTESRDATLPKRQSPVIIIAKHPEKRIGRPPQSLEPEYREEMNAIKVVLHQDFLPLFRQTGMIEREGRFIIEITK